MRMYVGIWFREVFLYCPVQCEQHMYISLDSQTVWHNPKPVNMYGLEVSATLQIGDPSVIANETGVVTVGDFRLADMSVGGQGAPLVPFLDRILLQTHYKTTGRSGAMLNIGGISNLTSWIPPSEMEGGSEGGTSTCGRTIAFDCGPGNMLIDALVQHYFSESYDASGHIALRGTPSKELVDFCCTRNDFLSVVPPKSTGREMYGVKFVQDIILKAEQLHLSPEDVIRSATEFTVEMIFQSFMLYINPQLEERLILRIDCPCDVYVSGGGVKNRTIMMSVHVFFVNE
jgi:anhydro-N-acetylmuramic acid kinase